MKEIPVYDSSGKRLDVLVQWDSDVYISLKDRGITSAHNVHFFNQSSDYSYVVTSQYASGVLTVKIPNILLTQSRNITGYVVVADSDEERSLFGFQIRVLPRPMPSDLIDIHSKDYITIGDIEESCRQYAASAESSATASAQLYDDISALALAAADSADAALASEQAALASQNAASGYATNASNSATAAHSSEVAAGNSATAAHDSEVAAGNSATSASNSATSASGSATSASNSATAAHNSEVAAGQSVTDASGYATSAQNSATAAHNSELAAEQSATDASTSATAASQSATAAHNSEVAASLSESAAASSATAAHGSEVSAGQSATAASTSETNAGTSATAAHNSEVAASQSAITASNSATAAHNSEVAASQSATAAGDSAISAANSATAASESAQGIEDAQAAAETAQRAAEAAQTAAENAAASASDSEEYVVGVVDDAYTRLEGVIADRLDGTGVIRKTISFTCNTSDWVEDQTPQYGYSFHYDILDSNIDANSVPYITLDETSVMIASRANMCPVARSYAGYVRILCELCPASQIAGILRIIGSL